MAVQPGAVAGLGPVGLDAVGHGDVGQVTAVVHEDPGQLVEGRMTVKDGEPGGGVTEHVEAGEPVGIVPVPESLQRLGRLQSVEPHVARADHPELQQLTRSSGELRTAISAPAKTRMDHQLRPFATCNVHSRDQPPLLPGVARERPEPVEEHFDASQPPARLPVVHGFECSRLFHDLVTIGLGLRPHGGSLDNRRVQRWCVEVIGSDGDRVHLSPHTTGPLAWSGDRVGVDVDDAGGGGLFRRHRCDLQAGSP